jgi:transcription elongation factor GreB
MSEKNYITKAGFEKLKNEAHQLFNIERPKVVETVAWAASNGDRSENADYIYGKRRLREIDRRLKFLRDRMDIAEIIQPEFIKSDKVVFGATIHLENESGEIKIYQIVGEDEIDTAGNKISWKSPIAKAVLGKKQGDEVLVKKPKSEDFVTIVKIVFV